MEVGSWKPVTSARVLAAEGSAGTSSQSMRPPCMDVIQKAEELPALEAVTK
jgi:hypothetical protein